MSNTFTHEEVKDILENVYDIYSIEYTNLCKTRFELRLNKQWKNWNNWANDDLRPDFIEEDIKSFIN